jgi:outer membrane protein assembly factor BamB
MSRHFVFAAAMFAACCSAQPLCAARSELVPETMAAQHGLTRPWFTQVQLDQGRGRLRDLVLHEGTLYAQTNRATVQAIDAENGRTLWCRQVGNPNYPSMTPVAYRDLVAVVNGSRLYVLDHRTGELLHEKEIGGTPGAGPAISTRRVYVPLNSGMIMAYRLEPVVNATKETEASQKGSDAKQKESKDTAVKVTKEESPTDANGHPIRRFRPNPAPPLFCQSYGHALVQPLVTRESSKEEYIVWPTDRGYLNIGYIDRTREDYLTLKFRMETGSPIVGRPAYLPPDPKVAGDSGLIVVASRDGFVHVIQEKTGQLLWRFSTGGAIVDSPAIVEDRIYVGTEQEGMYCLAIKTGKVFWQTPNAVRFVAAGKARVYAADRVGRLLAINAENGALLDSINIENIPIKLFNTSTDRIYLADDMGLVQCLHEVEQTEPLVHGKGRSSVASEAAEEKAVKEKPTKTDHFTPAAGGAPKKAAPKKPAASKKAADAAAADQFQTGAGDAAAGDNAKKPAKKAGKKAKAAAGL